MSRTIDERVVSMQFDNQQFERNVRTSLGTIERLKQSLNFKSASNGLESINRAAKSCTLAPLSNAADAVKLKFSAMEVMAVTALANITNSAVNTGKRIVSALTIDPVKTGLQEYETQIGAIQTILANTESKGTTLDDVNAALDELNTYADKTIYNFTQMTRNIGTFTAAGVGLKESTQAIKGIANLAAVSGSTSQQASTAMYQLSQALAAGRVTLMDWNSVVNAGMGGEVFQNALKRTSRMLGTGVDEAIKKYGTFRESLTQGNWLTKEVLVETLAQLSGAYTEAELIAQGFTKQQAAEITKLANTAEEAATKVKTFTQLLDTLKEAAQSGWTQTWEYILGDFDEAKWFFSNLSDTIGAFIGKSADSRNNLVGEALTSNYDKFIAKLEETGVEATDFEAKIKEVLKKHAYDVDTLTDKYGSLGRAFTHGAIPASILKEALDGLSQTAEISLDGIDRVLKKGVRGEDVKKAQAALKALGYDLGTFGENADGLDGILGSVTESAIKAFQAAHNLEATGIIDEKTLKALDEAANKTTVIGKELYSLVDGVNKLGGGELLRESITNVIKGVLNIIQTAKDAWGEVFNIEPEQIYNVLDVIHKYTNKFVEWTENNSEKIKMVFKGVFSVISVAWDGLKAVLSGVWKIASPILSVLGKGIFTAANAIGEWLVGLRESIIESGKFAEITDVVANAISTVIDFAKSLGKPVWEWIFGSENDADGQMTGLQQFIEKIRIFISESKAVAYVVEQFSTIGKKIRKYFTDLFPTKEELEQKAFNIRDIFTKIQGDIINFFKNFSAKDLIGKIRKFVENFGSKFNTDLLDIGFDLKSIKASIADKFVKIRDEIVNFFKNFSFEEVVSKIKDTFSKIGPAIRSFFEMVASMFGISKEKFEEIEEKIGGFFETIFGFLKDNKGSIAALGTLLGIIAILAKIKSTVKKIAGILKPLDDIKGAIISLIKSKEAINKATASKLKTEAVKNMAISIGIIAASLWVVSKIPKEDLLRASATVAVITGVVVGLLLLANAMGKTASKKSIANTISFGAMMASLGTALLLMTIAIKILGGMDRDELIQGGLAVAAFMALTTVLMKASKSINRGEFAKFGKMMKQLGWALLILSASVYIFGKMDTKALIQGGLAVTYFLGIMAGVMTISGLLDADVRSFGKMIRSLSVSLLLLSGVVYIFGKMDKETLIQGGLAVTTFLGIMMIAMSLSDKISKDVASFGRAMLGIGASLLLMALAVKIFGSMDVKTIVKGTLAIGAFTGIIVGLMAATKLMGENSVNAGKMSLMILSFAASMLIMAGAIVALSMIDGKDLTKALATIGGIGLIFAGLLVVTKYANSVEVGTIIALSGAIAILAASVAALAFVPEKDLIRATACLSVLIGMFSLLAFSSKFVNNKSLLGLAGMALIVGGIGLLFAKLSENVENADNAVKMATAIGIIVTALSASALMLSKIGSATGSNKGIYTGLIVFSALAGIVGIFAGIAIWQLPNIAKQLSSFMTELKPFIDDMNLIDYSMVRRINILGEAMSAFAGAGAKFAIANLFTFGGVSRAFTAFISFISQIVPVIKDAAIETSGVDIDFTNLDGIIKAIGGLAEAAALVPTNTIALAVTKWGGGFVVNVNDLYAFTTFVTSAIPIVQEFAIAIKNANIDTVAVGIVKDLFKAIEHLAEAADKAPGVDVAAGFAKFKGGAAGGLYVSYPDLYAFTNYVKGLLNALKEFIPGISGTVPNIPIEFITGIFDCIKKLAEAAKDAPSITIGLGFAKFKGLWGIFGGSTWTDLDAFRKYLVGDGSQKGAIDAVKDFINSINYEKLNGINAEKIGPIMTGITNVITAISALAEAADAAPKTTISVGIGVAISRIAKAVGFGVGRYYSTTDLEAFKDYLTGDDGAIAAAKSFIDAMIEVMPQLSEYDAATIESVTTGVSNVVNAISALAATASNAPTNINAKAKGGFGGWIKGLIGGYGEAELVTSTDLLGFKDWLIGSDGNGGMMNALTSFVDIFKDEETLNAVKKIEENTEGIDAVISAVTTLANLADKAPKQIDAKGGFAGVFGKLFMGLGFGGAGGGYGEYHSVTDLKNFTKWITEVTPVIKGFVVDASGITVPDGSALETVLSAIDTIATAAGNIKPKTEGWALGLGIIAGIPAGIFGTGTSATDYDGFIGLMEALGSSDGPLAKLVTTVNRLTFDGSVDSEASQKLTRVIEAVDALALAAQNMPTYEKLTGVLGVFAGYKKAPDFSGFITFIEGLTGTDENGNDNDTGIIKLINDANKDIPENLDTSKLEMVCSAIKTLAEAAKVLPESSWWKEKFSGEADFTGFSAWITTLSESIPAFGMAIQKSGITDEALTKIQSMVSVVKILAEAGNIISNGFTDVSVFGIADENGGKTPIDYIVDAFIAGANKLKELSEVDISNMATAGTVANQLANTMAILGGQYNTTLSIFADSSTAQTLIDAIDAIASALSSFQTAMVGVDLSILSSSSTAAHQIANTFSILQNIEYGNINTASLKIKLGELATAMSDFVTNTSSITGLGGATDKLNTLVTTLTSMSGGNYSGVTMFVEAVNSLGGIAETSTLSDDLVSLATSAVSDFVSVLNNSRKPISDAGAAMIVKFINGASSVKTLVKSAFSIIASSGISGVSGSYNGMITSGQYLGTGLVKGILSKKSSVYSAAYQLGKAAVQGERDGQKSKSPSKEAIKSGKWFGEGLVIGITNMASSVYSSSKSLGETAVNGLSRSIIKITDVINSDIDNQPTIRPVLDLSDVEAGANSISGMFGINPSVAVLSNVGAINSSMNNRQNGINNDVISAINDLGKKLGHTSGDTYQINGITYDDGSNVSDAVKTLVRAARIERRK